MNKLLFILTCLIIFLFIRDLVRCRKHIKYLNDIGMPHNIIKGMTCKEIIALSKYLNDYAKNKVKYNESHKDYRILNNIHNKYKIL